MFDSVDTFAPASLDDLDALERMLDDLDAQETDAPESFTFTPRAGYRVPIFAE